MQRSTDRILTTHTGSLPRPPELVTALAQRDHGEKRDLAELIRQSVADVVRRQIEAGVTIVNDGEASKISYATYVKERLDGFGGQSRPHPLSVEEVEFPEYTQERRSVSKHPSPAMPACVGPLAYRNLDLVRTDIANLKSALDGAVVADAFMTAASPGVISWFLENQYYPTHEAYIYALADVMKTEYDEIHKSGLVLQIDCPDLTVIRNEPGIDRESYRRLVKLHLDALDHATRDIPGDAMRLHLCWGNYEGPHTHDVSLGELIDLVFEARPAAISFEAANPRHAHEWTLFEHVKLPDGKLLIPGVLDSTTNYVEHPELIAQRLVQYAMLVGRENVIAGSDCGFATFATDLMVHPTITWAKLRAMSGGAALASERLWGRKAG